MTNALNSKSRTWLAYLLTGLPALFLLVDGIAKLVKPAPVIQATVDLGYPEHLIIPLGVVLTLCTIIYVIPQTAMLGVVLLTGYLGGAVNTHVRAWSGWFPVLFPVIVGVLLWGGLYLREARLHPLIPVTTPAPSASKAMRWAGYVLSVLPALLLLFSAIVKLSKAEPAVQGFKTLGYPDQALLCIGILELLCTVLYLIPRTSVIGAILLTGYMGGAMVTHIRVGEPFIIQIIIGIAIWGGLYLRDERLRQLLPIRR